MGRFSSKLRKDKRHFKMSFISSKKYEQALKERHHINHDKIVAISKKDISRFIKRQMFFYFYQSSKETFFQKRSFQKVKYKS